MATRFTIPLLLSAGLGLALTASPAHADTTHVVSRGQTLGRIAKRYHVSVERLYELNHLRPGERIRPGMVLVITRDHPEKPAPERRGAAHATHAKVGARAERAASYERRPKHRGQVHLVRGSDRLDVQMFGRHGRLNAAALAGLSRVLRFGPTGARTAIDPRLASLITMVSDHFGGRTIHVVSGFRPYSPMQYTPHSNHNKGRAIDFFVEGVPNAVVRDYCREFRDAGVGYYPNSSFVHLDVRSEKAFWIDYSRAGEAPQYDSPGSHRTADEAARDVERDPSPPGGDGHTSYVEAGSPPTP